MTTAAPPAVAIMEVYNTDVKCRHDEETPYTPHGVVCIRGRMWEIPRQHRG